MIFIILGLAVTGLLATEVIQWKRKNEEKNEIKPLPKWAKTETQSSPPNYFEHIAKGDSLAEKNHFTLAYGEYILANKLSPDVIEPLMKIGKLHLRRKDYEKAREVFQQILAKNVNDLEANINLGKTYIRLGKPEKALEIFNTIEEKNQLVLLYKGLLAAYQGRYEDSRNFLQEEVNMDQNSENAEIAKNILKSYETFSATQGSQLIYLKTLLGKNFNQADEYHLSIPLLFNVVKEKKDYRDAWVLLGYAYLNIEDTQNAIDALEQARKLDPHKPETLFFLGLSHQLKSINGDRIEKEKAASLIEEAIKKGFEPKIQAFQKLAELYFETGNYEKAAEKYEEVINLNSDDLGYFTRPLWLYVDKVGNPEKALALAQKALQTHPNDAMSYSFMGWALIAKKDYQGARENLSKALELDPTLAAAYLNFGKLFEQVEYRDTAKDYYKKAFELGKGTSVGDNAAERYNVMLEKEQSEKTKALRTGQANTVKP